MEGINLDQPILYKAASFRFFEKNECHVSRFCTDDVLLLVFEGVLRFSEEGQEYEIHPGEYYIQKKNTVQQGKVPSDSPKYLYVHFCADWSEGAAILPRRGRFEYFTLKPVMEQMNQSHHNHDSLTEQTAVFFALLSKLYTKKPETTPAGEIARFLSQHYTQPLTLDMLSAEFHFSKNHIINLFKKEYNMTPFEYINSLKIRQAEQLLIITSRSVESICYECGFHDYSYFYKLFYRKNHLSPAKWRKKKHLLPTEE